MLSRILLVKVHVFGKMSMMIFFFTVVYILKFVVYLLH